MIQSLRLREKVPRAWGSGRVASPRVPPSRGPARHSGAGAASLGGPGAALALDDAAQTLLDAALQPRHELAGGALDPTLLGEVPSLVLAALPLPRRLLGLAAPCDVDLVDAGVALLRADRVPGAVEPGDEVALIAHHLAGLVEAQGPVLFLALQAVGVADLQILGDVEVAQGLLGPAPEAAGQRLLGQLRPTLVVHGLSPVRLSRAGDVRAESGLAGEQHLLGVHLRVEGEDVPLLLTHALLPGELLDLLLPVVERHHDAGGCEATPLGVPDDEMNGATTEHGVTIPYVRNAHRLGARVRGVLLVEGRNAARVGATLGLLLFVARPAGVANTKADLRIEVRGIVPTDDGPVLVVCHLSGHGQVELGVALHLGRPLQLDPAGRAGRDLVLALGHPELVAARDIGGDPLVAELEGGASDWLPTRLAGRGVPKNTLDLVLDDVTRLVRVDELLLVVATHGPLGQATRSAVEGVAGIALVVQDLFVVYLGADREIHHLAWDC